MPSGAKTPWLPFPFTTKLRKRWPWIPGEDLSSRSPAFIAPLTWRVGLDSWPNTGPAADKVLIADHLSLRAARPSQIETVHGPGKVVTHGKSVTAEAL